MDANQTHYHLLLGREDWARCFEWQPERAATGDTLGFCWNASPPGCDLDWDEEQNELTLRPSVFLFLAPPADDKPTLAMRRGAASDRYGNLYWIDDDESGIRVFSSGCREQSQFWSTRECSSCPPPAPPHGAFQPEKKPVSSTPCGLRGLAVTENHYLVVGVVEPAGLLVFDLHAGGPPELLPWPKGIAFAPFDMAARPGGGVWILDREHHRYWGLDRQFNLIRLGPSGSSPEPDHPETFYPEGGTARTCPAKVYPSTIRLEDSALLDAVSPVAIEALPDGTVLILDAEEGSPPQSSSRIHRYRLSEPVGLPASLDAIREYVEDDKRNSFRLAGHDFAFVPVPDQDGRRVPDRLYVIGAEGNQAFAFSLRGGAVVQTEHEATPSGAGQWSLEPVPEFLPMRRFTGRGLLRVGLRLFYDSVNRWVPLVAQPQPRFKEQAMLATPIFDGREPDCVWHRLLLDACIPPETTVRVRTRAANDRRELEEDRVEWAKEEPPLHRRSDGSELPFVPRPRSSQAGTHELLFQSARGRFLQLRLELRGNHRASPRLRALRAYYPRFSYLTNYLPAVYREDKDSASFLERFLANPEGTLTATEDRIAAVQALFDPRGAPPEALDWLAGWFGVALDPQWDEERRRLFIENAMLFFQYRGTVRGLEMALRLVFDEMPDEKIFKAHPARCVCANRYRIVERFRTRPAPPVTPGETLPEKRCRGRAEQPPWRPEDGPEALHRRYVRFLAGDKASPGARFSLASPDERSRWQAFLRQRYDGDIGKLNTAHASELNDFAEAIFPAGVPAAGGLRTDWQEYLTLHGDRESWTQFARSIFGFVPDDNPDERAAWQAYLQAHYDGDLTRLNGAHTTHWNSFTEPSLPSDLPAAGGLREDWLAYITPPPPATLAGNRRRRWQAFLARRYVRIEALNADWQTRWDAFRSIPLPDVLPASAKALRDWFDFETLVMPTARAAHQFSVLLPVMQIERTDADHRQRKLRLARRVIELEKPAHTMHEVNFYWALFRVGEARLGLDTLLVEDVRALLLSSMILAEGFLASSYLAPAHPFDVADRLVVGRNRI